MKQWAAVTTVWCFLAISFHWQIGASTLNEGTSIVGTGNQGTPSQVNGRRSRITLPTVPFGDEYLEKSRMIFHAHQILFGPLFEYFKGINLNNVASTEDLNNVLNQFKNNYSNYFNLNSAPRNFRDRFYQIYHQRNEVCHQSYSIDCFSLDKEVLIEVANYLSRQTTVSNRESLVRSVSNALNYTGTTRNIGNINCSRYSNDNSGFTSTRNAGPRPRSSSRTTSNRNQAQQMG